MPQSRFKYLLLSFFIAIVLFLIFLQFNANRSITDLIKGNDQLKNELVLKNSLQKLRSDLLSIESKIKGAVIANDTQHLIRIEKEIDLIREDIDQIDKNNEAINSETQHFFAELKEQVLAKINFSNNIIDTLDFTGKPAAEAMLKNADGDQLTNHILKTIQELDASSQQDAITFSNATDKESHKALNWGIISVAMACFFGLIAFIFIAGRIKKQEQLIIALDKAQKKEKQLSSIKEQFLANMSHEIRTPMNAVLGFTHLLEKQEMNPLAKEYVQSIKHSGQNLMSIINDILDISKIEAGMLRIEKAPFSLRELLQSIRIMFESGLQSKNVQFITTVDEQIPDYLSGDSLRLTQILINLVNNAVKFTQQGRIEINITQEKQTSTGLNLVIEVKDTGIGIEPENLNGIFDRFVQADAATTRQHGGTGLGLSIVKQLVQLQNGWVKAESWPGKGSCFTFMIPYELDTNVIKPDQGTPPQNKISSLDHVQILVAEDNEMNQKLFKHIFDEWKLSYTFVNNGKEAVEILRNEKFRLVLMDIQMPLMDGYTAAQLIRSELQSAIPIIAMTAHAMQGEREKCLSYGMNDYISKPVNEQKLYEIIKHYTGNNISQSKNNQPQVQAHPYKVIQLDYLKELAGGDVEFEKEMTAEFLHLVPAQLEELKLAVTNAHFSKAGAIAHNMNTSVSFMGLTQTLKPVLEQMETLSSHNNPQQIAITLLQQIEACCKTAIEEAAHFLHSLSE